MIRADVDQIGGAPVGGVVMPENTLLVLSPWVALVGLVGFMAAVVAGTRESLHCVGARERTPATLLDRVVLGHCTGIAVGMTHILSY